MQIIAEFDTSNAFQRRFVPGPALDEHAAWHEGSGASDRRRLAADERGSIVALMNASGAATTINTYDEYGVRGASNAGRFQFTGAPWLPNVALYHMRARAYSPTLGRFLQTDPILHAGGMNLYAYVSDDPINLIDPFGLQDEEPNIFVRARVPWATQLSFVFWPSAPITSARREINPFGETIHLEDDDIVVTAPRPLRPPPPTILWWIRPSALSALIWAFTPTDVADATCRSATNPGGYDCSPAEDDETDDSSDRCVAGWMEEHQGYCTSAFRGSAVGRCRNRANDRLAACYRQGSTWPPPAGPDRWSHADELGLH